MSNPTPNEINPPPGGGGAPLGDVLDYLAQGGMPHSSISAEHIADGGVTMEKLDPAVLRHIKWEILNTIDQAIWDAGQEARTSLVRARHEAMRNPTGKA